MSTIASQNSPAVRLNDQDNVVVAREAIARGALVEAGLAAVADVAAGHKIATSAIPEGGKVLKYGQLIGFASRAIAPGEHVHLHNLIMTDPDLADEGPQKLNWQPPEVDRDRRFLGYARGDGAVGTRNFIGILSLGELLGHGVAATSPTISPQGRAGRLSQCRRCRRAHPWRRLRHEPPRPRAIGCLARTLGRLCASTRISAAILMIGLGCETNQITPIVEDLRPEGRASACAP